MPHHVLRDRRFREFESELQEFPVDTWSASSRIREAHLADQLDDFA